MGLLGLVLTAGLAACSDDGAGAQGTETRTLDVTMSFSQHRIDEGKPIANLRITNNDPEQRLEVSAIGLDWDGYPELTQLQPQDSVVLPEQTLDIRLQLPEPTCDADPGTPARGIVEAGGAAATEQLQESGQDFLVSIWSRACTVQRVAEVVDLAFDDEWRTTGRGPDEVLEGSLVLTRTAGSTEPAGIDGVEGSILLQAAARTPVVLAPGQESLRVPVTFTPYRCDAHARGESQQAFLFRVDVTIADEPARRITLTPTWEGFPDLAMDYHARACGPADETS